MTSGRRYELHGPRAGGPVPEQVPVPGIGQVLVRVLANGVCASDLTAWREGAGTLGHEPVGTAVEIGPGVDLAPGTLVTGRFVRSYADFVLADSVDIVEVPADVPLEQAAIAEPLGCVVEAMRRAPVQLAERVTVIGLGFMGLCMIQLLKLAATACVSGVDFREDARTAALRAGADEVFAPAELATRSADVDLVIEATGTQSGLDLATTLVRPHGRISLLGYHQSTRQVDLQSWNWKAIDVINAHVRDRHLLRSSTRAGLDLIAAGRVDFTPLITHRFPLDRVDEAFTLLETKPPGFTKAIIQLT
ncbi:zinc-binding dehydrogenase [Kribbella sp. NPDC051586]|uniref:zinc-binding dehydrogenase n=1 Tax=Kribbella sp. NPDC051586 TaxID=3364118 RepID=UPI0037896F74